VRGIRHLKPRMKKMWVMTSVETLGYYQESLRDEDEILVAMDETSPPL